MKLGYKKVISVIIAAVLVVGTITVYGDKNNSDIKVSKDSTGDYQSIQSAINSIKGTPTKNNQVTIWVSPGVYNEAVVVDKPYINIINNSTSEVKITYDKANGHIDESKNVGTDKTATFTLTNNAEGFSAKNITFINSYNIDEPNNDVRKQVQAVAFMSNADKVILDNCKFIGRQDTLYLKGASKGQNVYGQSNNARVYIKNSYIEGTVDYIFGDATAYFDNCNLKLAYYANGGHFTAPNTTLFNIGFVFNKCKFSIDNKYTQDMANKIDLGRPWQADAAYPYYGSNTVLINCILPSILNENGFTLWDKNTVVNKIRFYEFNSKTDKGQKIDLAKRASFVKILNDEQANAYSAFNVLIGNDGWNPTNERGNKSDIDITLNNYDINIPAGETYQLKAIVLPINNDKGLNFYSSDDLVASIDQNGIITANKIGNTKVYAKNSLGIDVVANINVTNPRTQLPKIKTINIENQSKLLVGQNLKARYSYELESDNSIDNAIIRWYAVNDNDKIILKEGIGDFYKSYVVQKNDIGYNIMIEVLPSTKTNYGKFGEAVAYKTESIVKSQNNDSSAIYRTSFDKGIKNWTTNGTWNTINNGYNNFISAMASEDKACSIFYDNNDLDNISFEGRFRFNPDKKGLGSTGYFNMYLNYDAYNDNGYMLKLGRGSNTKSIILSLYKLENGKEILLSSDNTSLKDKIFQSAGEENQYFNVNFAKNNDTITAQFTIEGNAAPNATLKATDSSPIASGAIGFKASGDEDIVLIDSISLYPSSNDNKDTKIKVYLMGDSTAKAYGNDNSIGGWGEYLVNYLDKDIEIINKAEGGRSARSYLNQGRLNEVLDKVSAGDYVFIQFGTNDQRTDELAFLEHSVVLGEPDENGIYPTMPAVKTKTPTQLYNNFKNTEYPYDTTFYPYDSGTFKWYMSKHVESIKRAGAVPVLLTPMSRIFFDKDGKIVSHFGENDGYVKAIKQLSEEENILCLDMYDITKNLYEQYGVLTTQGLHNINSDGSVDLTHYNKFGANLIASKMSEAIKESTLSIASHVVPSPLIVDKTTSLKTADLFVIGGTQASGDSTGDYAIKAGGYGDYLQDYLSSKITVKNMAVKNATAKSYIETPEYKNFISELKEGDYVVLNFGFDEGNSLGSKDENANYLKPSSNIEDKNSFGYYMYNYYIKPAKDKKAVIILMTPAQQRSFVNNEFVKVNNPYVQSTIDIVLENELFYVNLNDVTSNLFSTMGEEGSKVLNAIDRKNGLSSDIYSEFGAEIIAKKILTMMQSSSASLKDYIDTAKLNKNPVMTRGEFIEMTINALEIDVNYNDNFDDIVKGKSYERAVGIAKKLNIITGVGNINNFYPEDAATGDFARDVIEKIVIYKNIIISMENVYTLLRGDLSYEIGIWAIDKLYEALK